MANELNLIILEGSVGHFPNDNVAPWCIIYQIMMININLWNAEKI